MAACRWVYDSRHLQADCQEPGYQLRNPTLGNRVWTAFTFFTYIWWSVLDPNEGRQYGTLEINATTAQQSSTMGYLYLFIPSPPHSFISGLKLSFFANPFHRSLPFLLHDWLHGFVRLFTDTSEHIRFSCWFRSWFGRLLFELTHH